RTDICCSLSMESCPPRWTEEGRHRCGGFGRPTHTSVLLVATAAARPYDDVCKYVNRSAKELDRRMTDVTSHCWAGLPARTRHSGADQNEPSNSCYEKRSLILSKSCGVLCPGQ